VVASRKKDTLAASFCQQVAAWAPDRISSFYLVKNHKIDDNLTTTKAKEEYNLRFGIPII